MQSRQTGRGNYDKAVFNVTTCLCRYEKIVPSDGGNNAPAGAAQNGMRSRPMPPLYYFETSTTGGGRSGNDTSGGYGRPHGSSSGHHGAVRDSMQTKTWLWLARCMSLC